MPFSAHVSESAPSVHPERRGVRLTPRPPPFSSPPPPSAPPLPPPPSPPLAVALLLRPTAGSCLCDRRDSRTLLREQPGPVKTPRPPVKAPERPILHFPSPPPPPPPSPRPAVLPSDHSCSLRGRRGAGSLPWKIPVTTPAPQALCCDRQRPPSDFYAPRPAPRRPELHARIPRAVFPVRALALVLPSRPAVATISPGHSSQFRRHNQQRVYFDFSSSHQPIGSVSRPPILLVCGPAAPCPLLLIRARGKSTPTFCNNRLSSRQPVPTPAPYAPLPSRVRVLRRPRSLPFTLLASCICSALPGPLFWFPAVRGAVASPPAPASLSLARRQAIHRRRQSPGSRQRHTGLLLLHSNRRQKPRRRPRFPPPSSLPSSALLRPRPAPLRVIATISIRLPTTSIPDVPSSRHGARCC